MLEQLSDYNGPRGRIMSVTKQADGTFKISEECDGYFSTILTADELRTLGLELIALADSATQ